MRVLVFIIAREWRPVRCFPRRARCPPACKRTSRAHRQQTRHSPPPAFPALCTTAATLCLRHPEVCRRHGGDNLVINKHPLARPRRSWLRTAAVKEAMAPARARVVPASPRLPPGAQRRRGCKRGRFCQRFPQDHRRQRVGMGRPILRGGEGTPPPCIHTPVHDPPCTAGTPRTRVLVGNSARRVWPYTARLAMCRVMPAPPPKHPAAI